MQKTLRNKGGVHEFTLNVTVRYKGGGEGGGHFSPFFALHNISMAP